MIVLNMVYDTILPTCLSIRSMFLESLTVLLVTYRKNKSDVIV